MESYFLQISSLSSILSLLDWYDLCGKNKAMRPRKPHTFSTVSVSYLDGRCMSACFPIERLFSNYSDITNRLLLANIPHEASGTKNWELECEKTHSCKEAFGVQRQKTDRQMEESQNTTDVKRRREQRDFCGHRFCLIAAWIKAFLLNWPASCEPRPHFPKGHHNLSFSKYVKLFRLSAATSCLCLFSLTALLFLFLRPQHSCWQVHFAYL